MLFFPKIKFQQTTPTLDGLSYWRERILHSMLAIGARLGLLALGPAIFLAVTRRFWILLISAGIALILLGYLLLANQRNLRFRATLALSVAFLVGVIIIHQVGFLSGGTAWLFCFAVLSGVLLGFKAAITATLLNGAALVLLAWFDPSQNLAEQEFLRTLPRSLTAGANFLFLNLLSAAAVATLVNGLQKLNQQTEQASAELEAEKKALILTKEKLNQEIEVRRESEKTLQARERLYRTLAENIKDVIWTMDLNLKFTYVSPAVENLQGWTVKEIMQMGLEDIIVPDSLGKIHEEIQNKMASAKRMGSHNQTSILELESRKKNGATFWAEVTASFLLNEKGRPIGILGITRDITERNRAQREKEKLLESLTQSKKMEAIGKLAGGVAHDLNNVLSGIVSYPDLLLWNLPAESPLRKPIETIRESGKKAAAIVQDLLTLARRGVPVSETLKLNKVIKNYLSSPEFDRLNSFHPLVTVKTQLEPKLINIQGSPIHLFKTVMNLVSNAAESMPDGGEITITSYNAYLDRPVPGYTQVREGEYAVLAVGDSGIGISIEDISRIFEPFYTKKKMGRSGTGLGMAVVWGTVEDHLGYISIRSTVGAGTTVTLYLPGTHQEEAPKVETHSLDRYRGQGETILVVDDMKDQREIATRILTQLGYRAKSVANGEEAVNHMHREKADLIVLDMIMDPGMDGLDTFKRILEFYPQQKAIIVSGFSETDRVNNAQALGAGGYVRKPYVMEKLGQAVRIELDRTR